MHELSVVQALLREVAQIAAVHHATTVRRVTVQIGPLSGVDHDLLAGAFAVARDSGATRHCELLLELQPVRIRCGECGAESTVTPNRILCAACAGFRTTLLSGAELILKRVEFDAPGVRPCA